MKRPNILFIFADQMRASSLGCSGVENVMTPNLDAFSKPFLVRWPGHVPSGRVSSSLISLVDVMPTLVSIAGGTVPSEVQGVDLSGLLLGDGTVSQESVFINLPVSPIKWFSFREWRGVVTKQHTYARFRDKPWILYDDIEDPYQLRNLIEYPRYNDIRRDMEHKLQKWLERLNDPFETTVEVANKYYPGSTDSFIEYFENEKIKTGKEKRIKRL